MNKTIRLLPFIVDNALMQMAIDEAILTSCCSGNSPMTLRFYKMNPYGITIGNFQKTGSFKFDKIKEHGFDFVRRITGGTAVLHKNDFVYSIFIQENELPKKVVDAYNYISDGLVFGLRNLGINVDKRLSESKKRADSCYLNDNPYDIVWCGKKISGNAQTRCEGVVMQQGTIILEDNLEELIDCLNVERKEEYISHSRSKVTSVYSAFGRVPQNEEMEESFINGFIELFKSKNIELVRGEMSDYELLLAKKLYVEKYSSDNWNFEK